MFLYLFTTCRIHFTGIFRVCSHCLLCLTFFIRLVSSFQFESYTFHRSINRSANRYVFPYHQSLSILFIQIVYLSKSISIHAVIVTLSLPLSSFSPVISVCNTYHNRSIKIYPLSYKIVHQSITHRVITSFFTACHS